ncbi:MAG TPA: aspartate-semialdehyde dehydrogenase, partial [Acidobacteria bacterium]|nr:aspartate-semialdehyde dehydrogenase [Acidobacteriota bacterium]
MSGWRRLRVAVLGATGVVGQRLVALLAGHPWFETTVVAASPRSAGRRYGEVAGWRDGPLPAAVAELRVAPADVPAGVDLAFSALDAAAAREIEPLWTAAGVPVVSNASAFRMDPGVPLLVPEINEEHLALVRERGPGFVVTNPNCATSGLVLALAPLERAFGVEAVAVTTLQAISGAGYPGVPALDILGNVLPGIPGEEEKLEREAARILGRLEGGTIVPAPLTVSAQTFRVPVVHGHVLSLSIRLRRRATVDEAAAVLEAFGRDVHRDLPSAPSRPIRVLDGDAAPQPRLHLGSGMTVAVGRLRPCPVHHLRCVVLVDNLVRGAAGAALLNAELLAARGLLGRTPPVVASWRAEASPPAP